MKLRMSACVLLLLLGCGDETPQEKIVNSEEEWVCYNPDSEYHGHICTEECYWVGFQRSPKSFCWLITQQDCAGPIEFEWQRENCHLLENQ